jgi:hypothetical protein
METKFITKEEATKKLREKAFRVENPDSSDFGRSIIHSFRGNFGADWDLDNALLELSKAEKVAYTDHIFGHYLAIETKDGVVRFDVGKI